MLRIFCALVIAVAASVVAGQDAIFDGVDWSQPVVAANNDKYQSLSRELTPSFWEYSTNGQEAVKWQTVKVPKNARGKKVSFFIACGLGAGSGDKGLHELFFNGSRMAGFNTPYLDKLVAESKNGSMIFLPVYIDTNNDLFGIMQITPAAGLIHYGKRQTIEVKGKACGIKNWFMLSKLPAPEKIDAQKLQESREIGRQLQGIIAALADTKRRDAELTESITKWPDGRNAAVSIVKAGFDVSGLKEVEIFNPVTMELPQAADAAADKAVASGKWLIEIYPPEYFSGDKAKLLDKHLAYLKQLNCLIWTASPDEVKKYRRMQQQGKVLVENRKDGELHISIQGFPPGFVSSLPLTLQILLPDNTWEAEVFVEKSKRIPAEYAVIKGKRYVRFNLNPGAEADIRYKNN